MFVEPLNDKITDMLDYSLGYLSGNYHFPYPDGFDSLTEKEQENFWHCLNQEADNCDDCGWWFRLDEMSWFEEGGEPYCSKCFEDRLDYEREQNAKSD